MFKIQNKIIIVDDSPSELNTLSKAFLNNGIGCRPFQYDNAYFNPLKNIRIAFFDINLGEKTVDDSGKTPEEAEKLNSGVYNDLAVALNQYIAKDNGPFALIFWTKNKKIKDGFIKYMQNPDRGFSETAMPIFIGCIDKDEFIAATKESSLSEKLIKVLNNEKIKFLFDFESKAKEAGEKTINKLYEIIPKDINWGESTVLFDNFGNILSKIAASTLGFEHSKENPNKAVYEGLLPLLNSEIINSESDVIWKEILQPLYNGNISLPNDLIQRKINSVFHIEGTKGEKDIRGAVIEIDKSNQKYINSLNIESIEDWFGKLLSIKDGRDGIKASIINNSKLIAIELSAACDYSNKKARINKYILGALTPVIDVEKNINQKGRIESSYHLGNCDFHLNNDDFQIWLNLNFVFGTKRDDPRLGNSLFILKKEIMDMLGNKYASHISRIGITSF